MAAGKIDFTHHALTNPLRVVALHHSANELMAGNAVKTGIAFQDFPIGTTDARKQDLD